MNLDVGHFALLSAFFCTLNSLLAGGWGVASQSGVLFKSSKFAAAAITSARRTLLLAAIFVFIALLRLIQLFLQSDFQNLYVWQHSNLAMPWYYRITAVWGGMDGSMLLWASIMGLFIGLLLLGKRKIPAELLAWAIPVLAVAFGFFLSVVCFLTNPFRVVPIGAVITDGRGLNPLLQNPSMVIHPPLLYAGFTGFVIPFAFCFAALLSGSLGDRWIELTRRWTLVSWAFLTTGIILGGHWAYIELGWGGFWAWDPVENASFLPWLTATAFLHSVMVQQQRGMLKVWNISLAIITYALTVFGTFLTRSGIVQSVHAFAETDVGWVFLVYLGVLLVSGIFLIAYRWKALKPETQLQSYFSKEAAFLFNNLLLLGICFSTFWGVLFPVISEALSGDKSVVGPPFFNAINVPMFLGLLFLMGVGPLIAWRRASLSRFLKLFSVPLGLGSVVAIVFFIFEPREPLAAVAFGLGYFAMHVVAAEVRRAAKSRRTHSRAGRTESYALALRQKKRRFGGLLVHFGIAVMAVAITAASAYKLERDLVLKKGETLRFGDYALDLRNVREEKTADYAAIVSEIQVSDAESGEELSWMYPEKRSYFVSDEVTTEVSLRSTLREDLYLAVTGLDTSNTTPSTPLSSIPLLVKAYVNPLQVWVWFGGVLVLIGAIVVIFQNTLNFSHEEPV